MRTLPILGVTLLSTLFFVVACGPGSCPDDSEVVWADAEPIFTAHCISCHASSLTGVGV